MYEEIRFSHKPIMLCVA